MMILIWNPLAKRKRRKRAKKGDMDDMDDENKENEDDSGEATTWANQDRDYTYDELLQRVYNVMKEKNPDSVMGEKKKFVMRPPQVVKVGAKKTAFVNFTEIAKMLHRQPKHLLAFLFAELGTTGALDGICHLPHLSLSRHNLEQRDTPFFPPVYDMSLQVLSIDHQDWFPGCHWQEVGHQGQTIILIMVSRLLLA